jgi:hypothetical protein
MGKYATDDPTKCGCPCHDPNVTLLPAEFRPCCPRMGEKFLPGEQEICPACDGTGEDNGQLCKQCGGKVYL